MLVFLNFSPKRVENQKGGQKPCLWPKQGLAKVGLETGQSGTWPK